MHVGVLYVGGCVVLSCRCVVFKFEYVWILPVYMWAVLACVYVGCVCVVNVCGCVVLVYLHAWVVWWSCLLFFSLASIRVYEDEMITFTTRSRK